jgi:hypothetical protein
MERSKLRRGFLFTRRAVPIQRRGAMTGSAILQKKRFAPDDAYLIKYSRYEKQACLNKLYCF